MIYSNRICTTIRNIYMRHQHGSPQRMCYMTILKHTWTALRRMPNCCTDFAFSVVLAADSEAPCSMSGKAYLVRVTNMKSLDQGYLYPLLKDLKQTCHSRGIRTLQAGTLAKSYSNSLLIISRNIYRRSNGTWKFFEQTDSKNGSHSNLQAIVATRRHYHFVFNTYCTSHIPTGRNQFLPFALIDVWSFFAGAPADVQELGHPHVHLLLCAAVHCLPRGQPQPHLDLLLHRHPHL